MTSVGAACANGNESHTLLVAELPAHYHAIPYSDPGHTHTLELNAGYLVTAGGTQLVGGNGTTATTSSSFTGITFNSPNGANTTYSTGNNTPHSVVQPTIGINYIIRVL
jgi:microcystin-dependent protein